MLGPRAGLPAFRSLLMGLAPGEARVRATAGALRCAIRLSDHDAVDRLTALWEEAGPEPSIDIVVGLIGELRAHGLPEKAARLAAAEVTRAPSGRAHYLHGRCLAELGDPAAAAAFERAAKSEESGVQAAARTGLVEQLLRDPVRHAEAAEAASGLLTATATPVQRLVLASARLYASGRYGRVAALDELCELASRSAPAVARAAAFRAARHADERELTEIETDRVRSILRTMPRTLAEDAVARLDGQRHDPDAVAQLAAATELLQGGSLPAPHPGASARRRLGHACLLAVAACRRNAADDITAALSTIEGLLRQHGRTEPVLWTAIALATGATDRGARASAIGLALVALGTEGAAPPFGFVRLAGVLEHAGAEELAEHALARAACRDEPGARAALAGRRVGAAWRAYERGDRAEALTLLQAATPR